MRTKEEIREKLKMTEFIMDEYFDHLCDIKLWNGFVQMYWLLKWVLEDSKLGENSE